jgi:nitrite reductase/ring-hydroxylating ferredoxin subunit
MRVSHRTLLLMAIAVVQYGTSERRSHEPNRDRKWGHHMHTACPLHASRFNLREGSVDAPSAKLPVRSPEVTVIDGNTVANHRRTN